MQHGLEIKRLIVSIFILLGRALGSLPTAVLFHAQWRDSCRTTSSYTAAGSSPVPALISIPTFTANCTIHFVLIYLKVAQKLKELHFSKLNPSYMAIRSPDEVKSGLVTDMTE